MDVLTGATWGRTEGGLAHLHEPSQELELRENTRHL